MALSLALTCSATLAAREPVADDVGRDALDVSALAVSAERVYVGSFDAGLYVLEHDGALHPVQDPALDPNVNALAWSERERTLWVGTARGLARCPAAGACTRLGPEAAVHALLVTASGALVAGGDAGVTFIEHGELRTFGKKDGAPFRSVWALAEDGDRLFAGTTSGLFWGAPTAFSRAHAELGRAAVVLNTLPDDWVTGLAYRDGTLTVGTYSAGIAVLGATAMALEPSALDPAPGYVNPAGVVALDGGCLALATMDGLRVGAPNHTHTVPTRTRDVTAFVPDPRGGFWIGTRAGVEFWNGACAALE